jgi:hypothetical protein
MKTIFNGWNIMRRLRLVMGDIAILQTITTKEWI